MIRTLPMILLAAIAAPSYGALIVQGDVTSNLEGDLFFDNARTGGGDQTIQEGSAANLNRFFDYDVDGMITAPGPGTVTVQGFGFATSAAAAANDATLVDITITYLGANENFGGGDDVLLGTERVGYSFSGAGEYYVNFDTDPSAMIDGLGSRFRVAITPVDNNPGLQETIRFKTRPPQEQTFGHQGPSTSLSGTFVAAIPEPNAMALFGVMGLLATALKRR